MEWFGEQHLHPVSIFRFLDRMEMDPNLFWVLFPVTNSESGIIIKDVGYNWKPAIIFLNPKDSNVNNPRRQPGVRLPSGILALQGRKTLLMNMSLLASIHLFFLWSKFKFTFWLISFGYFLQPIFSLIHYASSGLKRFWGVLPPANAGGYSHITPSEWLGEPFPNLKDSYNTSIKPDWSWPPNRRRMPVSVLILLLK